MEEAVEPPAGKREVGGRWRPGLCLLAVAGALASAGGARADGSLLEALEAARTVAVGHLRAPEILDSHGRTGRFQVERALVGPAREDDALQVAWEERAPGRPPRFAAGERLLLGLGPLPADSIWRQRFPGRDAMAITGKGLAFLRQPLPASLAATPTGKSSGFPIPSPEASMICVIAPPGVIWKALWLIRQAT